MKEKLKRSYQNHFLGDPFRLAYGSLIMALRHNMGVSMEEKLAEVDKISFDDVVEFGDNWNNQLYVESFMSGNLGENDAITLSSKIQDLISKISTSLPKSKIDQVRAVSLPPKATWVIE